MRKLIFENLKKMKKEHHFYFNRAWERNWYIMSPMKNPKRQFFALNMKFSMCRDNSCTQVVDIIVTAAILFQYRPARSGVDDILMELNVRTVRWQFTRALSHQGRALLSITDTVPYLRAYWRPPGRLKNILGLQPQIAGSKWASIMHSKLDIVRPILKHILLQFI